MMSSPNSNANMSRANFAQFADACDANLIESEMTESKDEAIRELEGMSTTAPVSDITTENPQEESIKTTFTMMNCHWCNIVPSPKNRYSCPVGHTFCTLCGEERVVKHGAKCMIEIVDWEIDFGLPKNVALMMPIPRITTPYYKMDGLQNSHFPVCQQQISLLPEDPFYTDMWNRADLICPGGCNQFVKGRDLDKHLLHCEEQKKKSQLHHASKSKPEEELPSTSASSLESDLAVNCKMGMSKQPIVCNMNGCSMQMRAKHIACHVMLDHHVYALDVGNEKRFGNVAGVMYIPESEIKAKRPYYMIIRRCRRSFLFCMEHATDNSGYVGFWIRRISNMENTEEEDGPYFKYNLLIVNGNFRVVYKKDCIPWRKSNSEIFNDKNCLKLPISLILNELVLSCVDADENCSNDTKETGYLHVNFEITNPNAVGELYWDDAAEVVTSSMESLTTAATFADCTDQRHSDEDEEVQESVNDNNEVDFDDAEEENEEEAVDVGDDIDEDAGKKDEEKATNVNDNVDDDEDKKDKEDEPQPLVVNAIEENPNEMKTWFDQIYSEGETLNLKYTP